MLVLGSHTLKIEVADVKDHSLMWYFRDACSLTHVLPYHTSVGIVRKRESERGAKQTNTVVGRPEGLSAAEAALLAGVRHRAGQWRSSLPSRAGTNPSGAEKLKLNDPQGAQGRRDRPYSRRGKLRKGPLEEPAATQADAGSDVDIHHVPLPLIPKTRWERIWPAMACGSGLFSDGYINNVIGSVSTILGQIYGKSYTDSKAVTNISAITFAGTVVGQLVFGVTSDKWSRSNSLLLSTVVLIVFAALGAGSYGYHGSTQGMFAALTAYRFLVGIGIGGEYPAGSVACSESSGELEAGQRNRWFILFTNVMIDWGFVIGAFVPYLLVVICGDDHLRAAWRISLGLGVVPPLLLLYLRIKLKEPEEFTRESMKNVRIPYLLCLRYYGPRLFVVSLIWFMYDFSVYSFGIYSPTIVKGVIGPDASLAASFGWNTVINLFYIPGAMLGSVFSDWVGPRYGLAIGITLQALVGFIMAGLYGTLKNHIGAFCVVYGIFLSLGEFGPGDNIGLLASKTCATGVRGHYYAIAAATGKIGAFVGTYVFPRIEAAGHNDTTSAQYPFYVSSSLCILSAALALFCLPHVGQDTITLEDIKFRAYLERKGWDTRQLGLRKAESTETGETGFVNEQPVGEKL